MSRSLRKVSGSADELRFAYRHGQGWLGAAIGAGLVAWGLVGIEGTGGTVLAVFGLLVTLSGLSNALYRMELVVDLSSRTYRYRRGRLLSVEEGEGGVEDIKAVVLKKELERRGSEEVDEWEVELVLKGWPRPVEVAETRDGAVARREAESLATRLGVPLEERTGY